MLSLLYYPRSRKVGHFFLIYEIYQTVKFLLGGVQVLGDVEDEDAGVDFRIRMKEELELIENICEILAAAIDSRVLKNDAAGYIR